MFWKPLHIMPDGGDGFTEKLFLPQNPVKIHKKFMQYTNTLEFAHKCIMGKYSCLLENNSLYNLPLRQKTLCCSAHKVIFRLVSCNIVIQITHIWFRK